MLGADGNRTMTRMIMNIKGNEKLSAIPRALKEAISSNGLFQEVDRAFSGST